MANFNPSPQEIARLEEAAAEWFFKKDLGFSGTEEKEFESWLAKDPRHVEVFASIGGTWDQLPRVERLISRSRPNVVRKVLRFALPLAAAAAIALGYMSWWRPNHYSNEVTTEVGAWQEMNLPDGSVISVNTDSFVTVSFSPAERRVNLLKGEAHFAVAKNPNRPFTVESRGASVRAVGTAFNVRLKADRVEVLVTEGRVKVDPPRQFNDAMVREGNELSSLYLDAGHRVALSLVAPTESTPEENRVEVVATPVAEQSLAWQKRRLEFVDVPLSEMVEEFNRYNTHQLKIADPELAAMRFGGGFPASDSESFVRVLEETFHVEAKRSENVTVLRFAK